MIDGIDLNIIFICYASIFHCWIASVIDSLFATNQIWIPYIMRITIITIMSKDACQNMIGLVYLDPAEYHVSIACYDTWILIQAQCIRIGRIGHSYR